MSDNFSFRSAINGFNRNDVITYIEKILREKTELSVRVAALEKEIAETKENCEKEISNAAADREENALSLEKKAEELTTECDALKAAVAELEAKNASLEISYNAEIDALKSKENELIKEIESIRSKEADLIKEKEDALLIMTEKCSSCDIAKVCEARLGAAMLDAKRFSEILVKEANDKAASLFSDALQSAKASAEKAAVLAKNVDDISNQFNASFKILADNISGLGKNLDSFKGEIKLTGEKFDFTTD